MRTMVSILRWAARIPVVVLTALCCCVDAGQVGDIIVDSGLSGGVVVCVGCEDAQSVAELSVDGNFVVQVLDGDAARVTKMRTLLQSKGLHGRVTALTFDGTHLPYVDHLVNLIIVQGSSFNVRNDEIQRVLAPLGIVYAGGRKTVKPWPDELDTWPHWLHGPDNNAVSHDQQVGISRSLQWIMPPAWGRHHNLLHSINAMVSDAGRIYYIIDEAPIGARSHGDGWALVCRDAFNGLDLWRRPLANWGWSEWSAVETGVQMRFRGPNQLFRRLVAAGDTLYATLGFTEPVAAIDGKTGKTVKEYQGTENTSAILFGDGVLYLAKNVLEEKPGKTIMAVNAETGKILWEREGYTGITPHGTELGRFTDAHLTIGREKVFFLDVDDVVALDARTGEEAWRTPRPEMEQGVFGHYTFNFTHFCTLVYHDGTVFLGQIRPDPRNLNTWQEKEMVIRALDASTGGKRWEHTGMSLAHFTPPDLFINRGLVWTMKKGDVSLVGLDTRTGEVRKVYPVKNMLVGHHHRCYRNKATENFYLAGEEGIEYIDFHTGELDVHHWLRGACAYGIMPANGLIYLPAHACGCHGNTKLNGFLALANRSVALSGARKDGIDDREAEFTNLEKGPAYAEAPRLRAKPSATSWPVYKHDNRRSNSTPSTIPNNLTEQWTVSLGGRLTAPVIAENKVFLAAQDSHEVCCLAAESGAIQWRFAADGRIDTPPTCFNGRLFFGTRTGSVYSLTADTGELIWRFQAAPAHRYLTAYGQLESVWPVHGTIFIQSNKIYCVAGRSMHLDCGIFAYVLDVDSGTVLQQQQFQADTKSKGELHGAVLADILVGDENNIFMRNLRLNPKNIAEHGTKGPSEYLMPNDGGLLDPTWYNSAFWKYGSAAAQMLVFDDRHVVGVAAYGKQVSKSCPHDIFTVGNGYRLFAVDRGAGNESPAKHEPPTGKKGGKGKKKSRGTRSTVKRAWQATIPVRAEALVLADQKLCLAGAPDVADENDPWAAFENRKGGLLMILSKSGGKRLAEHQLDSAPVYDGMAAAGGKLFLSLKNGSLICFAAE